MAIGHKLSANEVTGKRPTQIQSVLRAAELLELLAQHPGGLSVREVSEATKLNVSTCHHLLATLITTGMVRSDPSQHRYSLGGKVTELYRHYTAGTSLVQRIRHLLEDLSLRSLETAYLAGWREGKLVLVDMVETVKPGIKQLQRGTTGPAHCRASGKVLLAALKEEDLEAYLRNNPLLARTAHTITREDDLRAELVRVRLQGFALDQEEYEEGWCCIAAPVTDRNDRVVAALAVSARMDRAVDMEELQRLAVQMAQFASVDFGDFL